MNRQLKSKQRGLNRSTLLHSAARRGDLDMAELLLEVGADPCKRDSLNRTALFWAFIGRYEKIIKKISSKLVDPATFIVDMDQNYNLLHLACSNGLVNLIWHYIEIGVDVNAKDREGMTALDHAKSSLGGQWSSISDTGQDGVAESIRILVALGEEPASAHRHFQGQVSTTTDTVDESHCRPCHRAWIPWSDTLYIERPLCHDENRLVVLTSDELPMLANTELATTSPDSHESSHNHLPELTS